MTPSTTRGLAAALLAVSAATACSSTVPGSGAGTTPAPAPTAVATAAAVAQADSAARARARADSARHPYTEADIRFMTAMIGHHGQALKIAAWAPTHGASDPIRTLAARIVNGQRDEIDRMQTWLRDRGLPVPEPDDSAAAAMHHGAGHGTGHGGHDAAMPGMLSAEQLAQLDQARGRDFDRLFLKFMIQHHQGAVTMVKELFGSYGAGQDETVFRLATDVNVDQITEIERMQRMLFEMLIESPSP